MPAARSPRTPAEGPDRDGDETDQRDEGRQPCGIGKPPGRISGDRGREGDPAHQAIERDDVDVCDGVGIAVQLDSRVSVEARDPQDAMREQAAGVEGNGHDVAGADLAWIHARDDQQ